MNAHIEWANRHTQDDPLSITNRWRKEGRFPEQEPSPIVNVWTTAPAAHVRRHVHVVNGHHRFTRRGPIELWVAVVEDNERRVMFSVAVPHIENVCKVERLLRRATERYDRDLARATKAATAPPLASRWTRLRRWIRR